MKKPREVHTLSHTTDHVASLHVINDLMGQQIQFAVVYDQGKPVISYPEQGRPAALKAVEQ